MPGAVDRHLYDARGSAVRRTPRTAVHRAGRVVHGRDHPARPAASPASSRPQAADPAGRPQAAPRGAARRRVRHGSLRAGGPHDDDTQHAHHPRPPPPRRRRRRAPSGAGPLRRDLRRPAPRRAGSGAAGPQLALRRRGDRPGAARGSGARRVRGEDPLVDGLRLARRGGERAEGGAAAAARRPLARGARPPSSRRCASTWSACSCRGPAARRSSTCAGSADGLGHRAHDLAVRRHRAPHRRPGRPRPGRGGHGSRGAARRVGQRGPRPLPCGRGQQRLPVAGDPPGDDPAVPGRPAEERPALRPEHRGRRALRRRQDPRPRAGEGRVRGRADARRPAAGGPGRAAHVDGGAGARDHLHGGARAAGRGGRAGPGHGGDRRPLAAAGGRAPARRGGPDRAAGGAAGQHLAAVLARRPAHRGPRPGRRARHGRRAVRPRGGGRGRAPPDAQRPQGGGQDHAGRAAARPAART